MRLGDFIRPDLTWVIQGSPSRDVLLKDLAERVAAAIDIDSAEVYDALLAREGKGSTGTPEGVALPHAMMPRLERNVVAVAMAPAGVDFAGKTGTRCDLVFVLVGPPGWEHVRLLARVARICHGHGALARLRQAATSEELYKRLVTEDQSHG